MSTAYIAEESEVLSAQGGFVYNGRELQPLNNIVLATFKGDNNEPASAFKVTINWGDGTTSTGTVSGPDQNGNFTVTGSHTYAEDGEQEMDLVDVFTITVTISNQNIATVTDTANIAEESEVLSAQGGFVITGKELQPLTNVVVATFKGDGNEPASAFKVTINWGDGTTSTGTVTGPDQNGNFIVTGSHTYPEEGEVEQDAVDAYTITVTISNQNTATVTDTANIAEEAEVLSGQ